MWEWRAANFMGPLLDRNLSVAEMILPTVISLMVIQTDANDRVRHCVTATMMASVTRELMTMADPTQVTSEAPSSTPSSTAAVPSKGCTGHRGSALS